MKKIRGIIIAVCMLVFTNLHGQKSMSFKNYRDGNRVVSIGASSSSVYIASSNGVIRRDYDGEVIELITTEKGLISDIVHEVFVIDDDEMWLATSEALHHIVNNSCIVFNQNSGLLNNIINSVCSDSDNNIWVANFGGFSQYNDGTWYSFPYTDTIGFKTIASYSDKVWGTTDGSGLLSFNGSSWSVHNVSNGFPSDRLNIMRTDTSGVLWISSYDNGLIEYDETWTVHDDTLLDGRIINDFHIDRLNEKWIFTDQGVIIYDSLQSWTEVEKLAQFNATKGWVDDEGNIWITTDKQVIKYFPEYDSVSYFKVGGLSSNLVTSVKTDIGDNNWVCTYGGISLYNNNWENISFSEINGSIESAYVTGIDTDSLDRVWLSYYNPIEISYFDDTVWTTFNSGNSSLNTSKILRTLAIDSSNYVWVGSESLGVQYFDGDNWNKLTTSNGLIHNNVNHIAVDRNNNKWIGTAYGISRFDGTTFTNFNESDGLIYREVTKIGVDSKNNIWVGTEKGLSMYDGQTWISYTADSGMAENYIRAIAIDTADHVWCGHQHGGLSQFDTNKNEWYKFNTSDGLASNQINAIDVDGENNLWIGTSYGLSVGKPSMVSLMINAINDHLKSTAKKIKVPVSVSNFSRIQAISFSLHFDQNVLQYESFEEGELYNLSIVDFDITDIDNGTITLNYQNSDILCQTIGNNSPIFYLLFDVINSTDSSEITLTGDPLPIVIKNYKGEILSYEVLSVKFKIDDLETKVSIKPGLGMRIYPNPAVSIVNIECEEFIEYIQINEISGRTLRIIKGNYQSFVQVNLEDFKQGLYMLRIRTLNREESVMIIKQ